MNDPAVISAQNSQHTKLTLAKKLKADGYHVVLEKQAGIDAIKEVYAFVNVAEAKQKLLGKEGVFEVL